MLKLFQEKAIHKIWKAETNGEISTNTCEHISRYYQFTDQELEEFVVKHSPPKKKRGRPRKSKDNNIDGQEQQKQVETVSLEKERPPKDEILKQDGEQPKLVEEPPKKKRGRPKKVDNISLPKDETPKQDVGQPKSVEEPLKKKLGRPKKVDNNSSKDKTPKPVEVTPQPVEVTPKSVEETPQQVEEKPKKKPGRPKKIENNSSSPDDTVPKERRPRKEKESIDHSLWADRMSTDKLDINRLVYDDGKSMKFWETFLDKDNNQVLIHYGKNTPDNKSKLIVPEQLLGGFHKTLIQKSFSTTWDTTQFIIKETDSKIKKGYQGPCVGCKCNDVSL